MITYKVKFKDDNEWNDYVFWYHEDAAEQFLKDSIDQGSTRRGTVIVKSPEQEWVLGFEIEYEPNFYFWEEE